MKRGVDDSKGKVIEAVAEPSSPCAYQSLVAFLGENRNPNLYLVLSLLSNRQPK